MQPFDYYRPKNLEEAFEYLTMPGKTVLPLAGGTDFVPMARDVLWKCDAVVDIKGIPGLKDLKETSEGLFVGSAVRMVEISRSALVKSGWDVLAQGASVVGSDQIRNRATLGGNMCTASPCADTLAPLAALNAVVVLRSKQGERRVPFVEFFTFVRKTVLQKGELVMGVILPKTSQGTVGSYEKLSRRRGCDLSIVSVAAVAAPKNGGYEWRVALGAVAPTVMRVAEAEAILGKGRSSEEIQKAAEAAAVASKPISDIRSSEAYRRVMVRNMTKRAVESVIAKMA
ncbi:MAG: xanthine dehydrogenase family protein subunit M [Chloroflexota bacterium]